MSADVDDDRPSALLTRLMALSPEGEAGRNALVRTGLAALGSRPSSTPSGGTVSAIRWTCC